MTLAAPVRIEADEDGAAKALWVQPQIIGDVDGLGLALRAEICAADGFTPDKAMMDRIVDEGIKGDLMVDGKRYGLVLDVGGYYKNVITLAPSLNITREEVDLAMRLLDEILRRVTKN